MDIVQKTRIRIHVPAVGSVVLIVFVCEILSSELGIKLLLLQSTHASAASSPIVAHILALLNPVVAIPVPIAVVVGVNYDLAVAVVAVVVSVFVFVLIVSIRATIVTVLLNYGDAPVVVGSDHRMTA